MEINEQDLVLELITAAKQQQKVSETQQKTLDELVAKKSRALDDLGENIAKQANALAVCQRELMNDQDERFTRQIQQIRSLSSKALKWKPVILTAFICFTLVFLSCAGSWLWLQTINDEIKAASAAKSQLEGYNAYLSKCEHDGEMYPCVQVMKSWGAYGDNGDIFILDPK